MKNRARNFIGILFLVLLAANILIRVGINYAEKHRPASSVVQVTPEPEPDYVEVKLTMKNFFDYFEYYEETHMTKANEGIISSAQFFYGYRLREGYEAANLASRKDTLKVVFRADGVIERGQYTVDYRSLTYTGTTESSDVTEVSEELGFWAKGNRTVLWQFGCYNSSYIIRLENMVPVSVSGSIYLLKNP